MSHSLTHDGETASELSECSRACDDKKCHSVWIASDARQKSLDWGSGGVAMSGAEHSASSLLT